MSLDNTDAGKEFMQLMDTQILCGKHPDILNEEVEWFAGLIEEFGMTPVYKNNRAIGSYLFMDVRYKMPVEFIDSKGHKFCCGRYVRTEHPTNLLMKIVVSTTFQRHVERPEGHDDWNPHYSVHFKLCGHHWPYGRKKVIVGELPAGMKDIYEYGDILHNFENRLRQNLQTIKDYIDNGKPVVFNKNK